MSYSIIYQCLSVKQIYVLFSLTNHMSLIVTLKCILLCAIYILVFHSNFFFNFSKYHCSISDFYYLLLNYSKFFKFHLMQNPNCKGSLLNVSILNRDRRGISFCCCCCFYRALIFCSLTSYHPNFFTNNNTLILQINLSPTKYLLVGRNSCDRLYIMIRGMLFALKQINKIKQKEKN